METRISLFFAILAMSLIAACVTPEQRYAQEQRRQAEQRAAYAQRQALLEGRCRGYGFEQRTAAFAQCLMKLDQAEQQVEFQIKQRAELESRCGLAEAQGWLGPSATGSFAEAAQRAAAAHSACMAGLPPPSSGRFICRREGRDGAYCFSQ